MRTILLLVLLSAAVGCAKKVAKSTAPGRDDSANAKPQQQPQTPTPGNKDKKGGKNEPNWLTDPRFKKDPPQGQPAPAGETPAGDGASPGKQPWGIAPPQGGWQGPATGAQPMLPGDPTVVPGGVIPLAPGVVGAPPIGGIGAPGLPGVGGQQPNPNPPPLAPGGGTPLGAAKKVAAQADMKEIWVFIENHSGASGKMPTQVEIYAALVDAKSPAAELVKNGAIYLTGATARESVWAFEARAVTSGGLVVSQNGVETLTADELKKRLGK